MSTNKLSYLSIWNTSPFYSKSNLSHTYRYVGKMLTRRYSLVDVSNQLHGRSLMITRVSFITLPSVLHVIWVYNFILNATYLLCLYIISTFTDYLIFLDFFIGNVNNRDRLIFFLFTLFSRTCESWTFIIILSMKFRVS